MSAYETMRPRFSISWQAAFMLLSGALLALPVLAGEPAPPPQSDDPAIAAALRYQHGDGTATNPGRAAEMYCVAAHEGNADAAYRLGWMYANGDGIARDDGHAAALFQRAASQGHDSAARMLAGMNMSDARMPLCITLPPPPVVAMEADTDGEAPVPDTPENTRAAPAESAGSTSAAATGAAPAPAASLPAASPPDADQIAFAIARWADAWARREIDRYLAAYAPDFELRPGESRQQWERQRRARITGKAWIEIKIRNLAIAVEGDLAKARFVQQYRSSTGHESTMKTLMLVKSERTWLIRQEESLALPASTTAR